MEYDKYVVTEAEYEKNKSSALDMRNEERSNMLRQRVKQAIQI
mgnify:CR=1 FL=1